MFKVIAFLMVLLLPISAYAVDGNEILARVDKNLAPDSYEMYRKLINVEPGGRKKEFVQIGRASCRERV